MTAIAPPRLLEFTWTDKDDDLGFVRWELTAEDGGTHLVLTHTFSEAARRFGLPSLAGWHSLFDNLAALLDGEPKRERWQDKSPSARSGCHNVTLVRRLRCWPSTRR